MPDWGEKFIMATAMVGGLIAMHINDIGGAYVLFTFVLIYLIILGIEAWHDREKAKEKCLGTLVFFIEEGEQEDEAKEKTEVG